MQLNVKNETSTLKAVVLGQPGSIGKVPTLEETYDAKSYESVLHNIYPHEEDIFKEMRCFESVLLKYGVQVYRPWTLENCNRAGYKGLQTLYYCKAPHHLPLRAPFREG